MALPTTPGGLPTPRREPNVSPKRESVSLPPLEPIDSLPEIRERRAPVAQEQVKKRVPTQAPLKPKPVKKPTAPVAEPVTEVSTKEDLPEGWAVDKKTGKKYRKLPKTVMGDDGKPMLQIPDFNLDDLTGEAEIFLAHLRVPPDKVEQQRLRDLKTQQARKQNAQYVKDHKDEDADDPEGV